MDSTLAGVIIGLLTNGLSAALGDSARSLQELVAPRGDGRALDALIGDAVDELLRWEQAHSFDDELVIQFLASPEAAHVVKQMFIAHLGKVEIADVARREFAEVAVIWTEGKLALDAARALFDVLVECTNRALGEAIEQGVLAAHEARSSFRFNVLLGEIQNTQRTLESLTGASLDLPRILKFERAFREHVAKATELLTPPYLEAARRVPIDQLFVSPRLRRAESSDEQSQPLAVDAVLSQTYRLVVLGNPGGGKSTLVQKVCHDLAVQPSEVPARERVPTPVLVTLRDYGARKQASACSIKDFLYELAHTRYQLDPPANAFEYLLSQGRLMVLFDGLDELVVTQARQAVTEDVEHFCSEYTGLPVVVTSRKVGYDQAPLDPRQFERFELEEFSVEQSADYARKWFSVDESLSKAEQSELAGAFTKECDPVPDLRSNALMLGLLCNIYRGENWIPKNRPEVYEKCAVMLFDRWDKRRGIVAFQTFESHLRSALEYLAHWIFCDPARQSGVSEVDLIEVTADYLCEVRFPDRIEAENAAKQFIEFCRGRAWVFTDTGSTGEGESLYQFTHRTFLEYFTAVHLTRTHPTPELLGTLLRPRIRKSEWEIVAQLAVQIQNRQVDRSGDILLNEVLDDVQEVGGAGVAASRGFASRTLKFLVPAPATTRRVAYEATRLLLSFGRGHIADASERRNASDPEGPVRVFGDLLSCSAENWAMVEAGAMDALDAMFSGDDALDKRVASELALNLTFPFGRAEVGAADGKGKANKQWRGASSRFRSRHGSQLDALASQDFDTACDLLWRGEMASIQLVDEHGTDALFRCRTYACFPGTTRISRADLLTQVACFGRGIFNDVNLESLEIDLAQLGGRFRALPAPWVTRCGRSRWWEGWPYEAKRLAPEILDPTGDVFFGLFGLFAVQVEAVKAREALGREGHGRFDEMPEEPRWSVLRALMAQRDGGHEVASGELPVDEDCRGFLMSWARGEQNLFAPNAASARELGTQ